MKPSAALLSTIKEYLALVDSGSVSDERSELHNRVMDEMKAEGFVFQTRDEARELAKELTRESKTMKEHPIIFSQPMVRAILENRKTQTRRVIKPQPHIPVPGWARDNPTTPSLFAMEWKQILFKSTEDFAALHCPYGKPGDTLWVRETWCPAVASGYDAPDDGRLGTNPDDDVPFPVWYKATDEGKVDVTRSKYDDEPGWKPGWHPSIHMPRWASRVTLEVVKVRVERVQDIEAGDIEAEGTPHNPMQSLVYRGDDFNRCHDYAWLWNFINAKRGYSWEQNPYVWVVEFKIV